MRISNDKGMLCEHCCTDMAQLDELGYLYGGSRDIGGGVRLFLCLHGTDEFRLYYCPFCGTEIEIEEG